MSIVREPRTPFVRQRLALARRSAANIMQETTEEETAQWYRQYYARKGRDRNNVLTNPGALFQQIALQRSVIQALRTLNVATGWKILDVGCGSGDSLLQFLNLGFAPGNLHGIELLCDRIAHAQQRLPTANFVRGDASRMGYVSDSFDLVMESTMFIQLHDRVASARIAQEMLRVTKPSGYLMLVDWRYSYGYPEYTALSGKRIAQLFGVDRQTTLHSRTRGALVPPIGRVLSAHLPSFYFLVQRVAPFLVGQVVTVLRKRDAVPA